MAEKYAGKGASLAYGDGPTTVANFRDGSQSGGEAERIDVTTHDSPGGRREFRAGFKGESQYEFQIIYDPADASHIGLAELYATGEVVAWTLTLPDTGQSDITFNAYVANFPIPALPIDGPLTVDVTLQIDGDINFPGS